MSSDDERILDFFDADIHRDGYAIEVGAADGLFTSPTLALEQRGWHVVCVEPNPLYAAAARMTRKHVVQAACADFIANEYPFTICNTEPHCKLHEMQGGSSLDVKRTELSRLGWTPKGEQRINVLVLTLDAIMQSYFAPSRQDRLTTQLNFLSIDTEGTEDAVLRGFNFEKWGKPRVICAENWPGMNKTDHILLPLGYKKIERVAGNYTDWYKYE